jgi:hypothetical protein
MVQMSFVLREGSGIAVASNRGASVTGLTMHYTTAAIEEIRPACGSPAL